MECFDHDVLVVTWIASEIIIFEVLSYEYYNHTRLEWFVLIPSPMQVQKKLGYCPQFDALIDKLTGRETLHMYARLRGVHEQQIRKMVQQLIDTLLLEPHADKLVSSYRFVN